MEHHHDFYRGGPPRTRFTDRGECDVYWGGPPRNAIYRPSGMRCLPRGTPPERDLPTEGNAMSTEGDPPGTWFTDRGECDVYRGGPPRNAIYRRRGTRSRFLGGTHTSIPPKARNTIAISTQGDYSEWICCTGGPETIAAPLIVNVKISPICKQFVLHSIKYE